MKPGNIFSAEQEAHRFIDAVKAMRARAETDKHFAEYLDITGFKETGAVRRASLDLTRTLAKMRKP